MCIIPHNSVGQLGSSGLSCLGSSLQSGWHLTGAGWSRIALLMTGSRQTVGLGASEGTDWGLYSRWSLITQGSSPGLEGKLKAKALFKPLLVVQIFSYPISQKMAKPRVNMKGPPRVWTQEGVNILGPELQQSLRGNGEFSKLFSRE